MYPAAGTPFSQPYSSPYTQYPPYPPYPQYPQYGPGHGGYGLPPAEMNQYPMYRGREDNQPHMSPSFDDVTVRSKFIRKVYTILSVQLGFTVLFILPFMYVDEVQEFVYDYTWLSFVFLGVFIVPYMMLVCCESTRRSFPTNMILLFIMTFGMSGVCGFVTAKLDTEIVFYTVLLTVVVTLSITILSVFCPFDITSCQMLLCVLSIIVAVFGMIATIMIIVTHSRIISLVYSSVCVVLFSMFLMFDTQAIIGGRRIELSPEEYVLAAVQLYVDIIEIFLNLLQLVGACTESD